MPVQNVRHTITSDGTHGLLVLQETNWIYFIEKDSIDLESLGSEVDIEQNELEIDTNTNLAIVKYLVNNFYNTAGDNLHEFLVNSLMPYREVTDQYIQLNGWLF